ncbi:MAG: monovalent cation/H+ antiporter complex subunit F [Actinomycetota bacterium]
MIAAIAITCFLVSGACGAARVLLGPRLADRVAALDVALMSLMGAIVVRAADTGDTAYINLLVVIAIVGFTATVAASQFIEHGGGRE